MCAAESSANLAVSISGTLFGASAAARKVACSTASLPAQPSDSSTFYPSMGSALELPEGHLELKSHRSLTSSPTAT